MKHCYVNTRRFDSQEKIRLARHEIGHAHIVRRFGGYATAEIWRTATSSHDERTWSGTCKIYLVPGKMTMDRKTKSLLKILPAPKNWLVLVGLAGIVGEEVGSGERDPAQIYETVNDAILSGYVSDTDLEQIEDKFCVADIAQVVKLLVEDLDQFNLEVNHLLHMEYRTEISAPNKIDPIAAQVMH